MNLNKLLQDNAIKFSDKPAIFFKNKPVSFLKLKEICFRLAGSLTQLGIKKGDKVALYLPNCPEYVYGYLAIWCCGATAVPLDFMLTQDELISCIGHSEAKLLIAKSKPAVSFTKIKEECPQLQQIASCHEETKDCLSLEGLLKKGKDEPQKIDIQDKDYAIIFYTSGTTGKPKGVLVNYLQLGAPSKAMGFFVDLSDKDIILCALPLSHLGGLVYLQDCIAFGITMVLMERFAPQELLKNVENYKITCFWLVPSMYYAMLQLKEFEIFDLSSLRWIVSFGASSSADALHRFHQYCPQAHFFNGWGLTETNAPTTVIPKDSQKIESIGRPAPWIQVKVVDEEDKELSVGEVGEIVVKGWVVSDGYYKDAQLTAEAIRNGWFHTGDLGRFDRDKDLYIVGRKKEMIKVGGEIVFEPEVEAAMHKHPDIAEVAVIGVFDKLRGEVPKAFVVIKEGKNLSEEDLRCFCRKHLAHFKIPHYFEFTDSLPKNRTGKFDKETLRTKERAFI